MDEQAQRLREQRLAREAEIRAGATDWTGRVREAVEQALRNGSTVRLDLVDELVLRGSANIEDMASKYGGSHVRDAHLAQITMILHGRERVVLEHQTGTPDDWLISDLRSRTYKVHPEFAKAWKAVRSLQGRRFDLTQGQPRK